MSLARHVLVWVEARRVLQPSSCCSAGMLVLIVSGQVLTAWTGMTAAGRVQKMSQDDQPIPPPRSKRTRLRVAALVPDGYTPYMRCDDSDL